MIELPIASPGSWPLRSDTVGASMGRWMVWLEARVVADGHPFPLDLDLRIRAYEPKAHCALRRPEVMEFRLDVDADDALAAVHHFVDRLNEIAAREQFGPLLPLTLMALPF